jgi:uncharacterized protein (DUF2267 family)
MPTTPDFEAKVQAVEGWIAALSHRLEWHDRRRTWLALVAVLHAIRDCLGRDEAVYFAAELPTLLRGFYYEGWHPRARRLTGREAFLERIRDGLKHDLAVDAETVARAVMLEIARRVPSAELEDAKAATPPDIHGLWPS